MILEKYIHECYDGKGIKGSSPKTTFIAYGADLTLSKLADDDEKLMNWYGEKGLTKKDYYLVVGRFVPENSFEVMIREFMKSKSKKNFAIITNKEFILGSLLMLVSAILMFVDGMKGFLLQLVILLIGFTVFSKTWIPMLQFFLNKIQRKRVS